MYKADILLYFFSEIKVFLLLLLFCLSVKLIPSVYVIACSHFNNIRITDINIGLRGHRRHSRSVSNNQMVIFPVFTHIHYISNTVLRLPLS